VLSYSRKAYSEAVTKQDTETFLRCLENGLRSFGEVPHLLNLDNLKAAVLKANWFDPEINPKLADFCRHYGLHVMPCRPSRPQHKGKVERGVAYVRSNALKGRRFKSLAEEKLFLGQWERAVADKRIHGTTRKQVVACFEEERPHLQPLPESLFPCYQEARRNVHRPVILPLMAAYFFMMTGFSIVTAFFAIFTEDRFGYNASANGYIFASVGVIGAIVQGALIGPLLKNFTEKRIAITGLALLSCSMFALPLAQRATMLLLVTAGIAVGNAFINPTINGLVSGSVNKYSQGRVLGLMQACASLGRFVGPLLGGWLLAFNARSTLEFGKAPFWISSALLMVSLFLTTMVSVRRADTREQGLPGEA
jgi:hypothetical protein